MVIHACVGGHGLLGLGSRGPLLQENLLRSAAQRHFLRLPRRVSEKMRDS
jgi:hypothetical protein